jgi:hypothetical protein
MLPPSTLVRILHVLLLYRQSVALAGTAMPHRLPRLVRQHDHAGIGCPDKELRALSAAKGVRLTQIGIGDGNLSWFKPHATYRIKDEHSLGQVHTCTLRW